VLGRDSEVVRVVGVVRFHGESGRVRGLARVRAVRDGGRDLGPLTVAASTSNTQPEGRACRVGQAHAVVHCHEVAALAKAV